MNYDALDTGLSSSETLSRLKQFGPNTLPEASPPQLYSLLIHQFNSAVIYVLLVATVVSFALGHNINTAFILLVLVLFQYDNDGFSWSVSVQGKARLAGNGPVLSKRRNAAMDADRPILRALLWCPAAALQRLTRTMAIACALRLAAKHHRNAEPLIIILKEY